MYQRGFIHHFIAGRVPCAHERNVRQAGIAQQHICAGQKRDDHAKVGKRLEFAMRQNSDGCNIDVTFIPDIRPNTHLEFRHSCRKKAPPLCWITEKGCHKKRHGSRTLFSRICRRTSSDITSVPLPTLVSLCGRYFYKRRKQRDTSNSMIVVWLWIDVPTDDSPRCW